MGMTRPGYSRPNFSRLCLVPLRTELGFDDPRESWLPDGRTPKEALRNNLLHLFDHSFFKLPYFDLAQAIDEELERI